jgi:hypothetical protein
MWNLYLWFNCLPHFRTYVFYYIPLHNSCIFSHFFGPKSMGALFMWGFMNIAHHGKYYCLLNLHYKKMEDMCGLLVTKEALFTVFCNTFLSLYCITFSWTTILISSKQSKTSVIIFTDSFFDLRCCSLHVSLVWYCGSVSHPHVLKVVQIKWQMILASCSIFPPTRNVSVLYVLLSI